VWLASDRQGHLGAFITAGIGPIPKKALDASQMAIEEIEGSLCQLPSVSQAHLLVSVPRPDDFIDLAERGLFVYDWTDINRTVDKALCVYEPVAVPVTPITIGSLPVELSALARVLKIANVDFLDGDAINIRAHLICIEAD
jgi:hypothetical protein